MKNFIKQGLTLLFLLISLATYAQYKYGTLPLPGLCHKWECTNCDKKTSIEFTSNFKGQLHIDGQGTINFRWMEATKCGQIWWYKSSLLNNSLVSYVEMVSEYSTIQNQWANWDTLNVLFSCSYSGDGGTKPIVFQGLNMWKFETKSTVTGCPATETNCGSSGAENCKKYKDLIKKGRDFEEKGDYTSALRCYSEAYKMEALLPSNCEKEDLETLIADVMDAKEKGGIPKKKTTTTKTQNSKSGTRISDYMPDSEFDSWLKRVESSSNEMCTLLTQMMAAASRGEMPSNPEAIEQSSNKLAAVYKELTEKNYMLSEEQHGRMANVLNKFQDCVNDLTKGITGGASIPIDLSSMVPSFTPPRPIPLNDESAGTANTPNSSGAGSEYSGNRGDGTFEGARLENTPGQCKPGSSGLKRKKK